MDTKHRRTSLLDLKREELVKLRLEAHRAKYPEGPTSMGLGALHAESAVPLASCELSETPSQWRKSSPPLKQARLLPEVPSPPALSLQCPPLLMGGPNPSGPLTRTSTARSASLSKIAEEELVLPRLPSKRSTSVVAICAGGVTPAMASVMARGVQVLRAGYFCKYARGQASVFKIRNWRRRYCVLSAVGLHYFAGAQATAVKGEVLWGDRTAVTFEAKHGREHCFVIGNPYAKPLVVACSSEREKRVWKAHIGLALADINRKNRCCSAALRCSSCSATTARRRKSSSITAISA